MSGSGVGETPNAAFAALSARCLARADGHQGLSSSITESQSYLDRGDDKAFTETLNRRCRALDNQGLSKPDKITLSTVAMFKTGDNLEKWMGSIWGQLLLHQGGASLQQWVHEINFQDNGLHPPAFIVHTAVHKFTPRDADTATLEAMMERGELFGTTAESFFPNQPRSLLIGDEVEVLIGMPTETEGEYRDEWVDRQAIISFIEDDRYLVHSRVGPAEESTRWYPSDRVRRAPRAHGFSTPRHGGLPRDDRSTARQVGPIIDKGVLESGIYDPALHKVWMCYLIYARLPLSAQRLDKTLLPMFLGKLADLALREACSVAAGGRFSKAVVGLYAYVGMNPGVQLVTELNTTHMTYVDLATLALALPKRQLAL